MRNYNIDREPISSDEISTFKDFKSILRKNAQTTEDLAKIKPANSSSKLYWGVGSLLGAAVISLAVILGVDNDANEIVSEEIVEVVEVKETVAIDWQTIIRTPQNSIETTIGVNLISAERVEFAEFKNVDEVSHLMSNVAHSDAEFVKESLVFKIENEEEVEISNGNDLYSLNSNGEWQKVEHLPVVMPYVEKPVLLSKGDVAIQMNFNNFEGPASKYENVFWKPVNIKDLDESFFTTEWEDASVERTSVNGIYSLTFKSGEVEKRFNGFPALQKGAYKKALKEYNTSLLKVQEELMIAPKSYTVSKGIYTIK